MSGETMHELGSEESIAEAVAYLAARNGQAAPEAPADESAVEAAEAAAEPADEVTPEPVAEPVAEPELKPAKFKPTPDQLMMYRQQKRFEAELEKRDELLRELLYRVAPQVRDAPDPAVEEDEFADPLEKRMAELERKHEREIKSLQGAETERRQAAILNEIQTDVRAAFATAPYLAPFENEIYVAIERDAHRALAESQKTGKAPTFTAIAQIVKSYDAQVRAAFQKLNPAAAAQVLSGRAPAPASGRAASAPSPRAPGATVPATPRAGTSVSTQPPDFSKMSWEETSQYAVKMYGGTRK